MTDELSIDDLANHSGLSVRTLHYYMQEGLLPGQTSAVNMPATRKSTWIVWT